MSETRGLWNPEIANCGIVGLGEGPYCVAIAAVGSWPTEGYDAPMVAWDWDADERGDALAFSGHSREEWLALADEMLRRWAEFRRAVEALPESSPTPQSAVDVPAPSTPEEPT